MDITRVLLAAAARLLPPPARARLTITSPRYLARLASQQGATQRSTADAAFRTLCCQVLAGELTAGRLWNLPGDLPIRIAGELGLKPDKLWDQKTINDQLINLCYISKDQWILSNLCFNGNYSYMGSPIWLVAACNHNTPWESALGVLVRLPAELPECPCSNFSDLKAALRQLRNIHLHGGKYGTRSAIVVGTVLKAHQGEKVAIMAGLKERNYLLWHCRQVHRARVRGLFRASP